MKKGQTSLSGGRSQVREIITCIAVNADIIRSLLAVVNAAYRYTQEAFFCNKTFNNLLKVTCWFTCRLMTLLLRNHAFFEMFFINFRMFYKG